MMTKYLITAPDGQKYNVSAPAEATLEQVLTYAKEQFAKKQTDQAAQLEADRKTYAPTEGMSPLERFRAGMGQAMVGAGRGVGQLFGAVDQADIDEAKKRDASLEDTTAGKIGNITGSVAMFAPTAAIPGANTVTGGALIGALISALTTPGSAADRGTAGLLGGAGGAVGQLLPKIFGSVKAAAQPLTEAGRSKIIGRVMNSAAGDNAQAVAARLRSAGELIPGSAPTAAEVGESGGIAALQRAMSAADPEAYAHRAAQQSGARAAAAGDIAGDEGQKEFFKQMREKTAKDLYEKAFAVPVEIENLSPAMKVEVTKLMQMPAIQEGLATARTNTLNHGMKIETMEGSVAGLHQTKLALDDKISKLMNGSAAEIHKTSGIRAARDRLVTFIEKMSPDYHEARTTYAAMSKPVNQMDVGQKFYDTLKPALSDSGAIGKEASNSFARALRYGDQTASLATGRNLKLADALEPGQIQTLGNISADLARKSNAQDLGRGVGSNTFQNFAMDNLSQSMGMPSAVKALGSIIPGLSPTATIIQKGAGALGNVTYKKADEAMRQAMAKALLNPQEAALLMDQASRPAMIARLLQSLPQSVQQKIPPADILKLIQTMPGVAGTVAAQQYAN